MSDRPQPVLEHLAELRRRIIYALAAVAAGVGLAAIFVHRILLVIITDLRAETGIVPVQYSFADTFLTELRLAVIGGLALALPLVLYQAVAFVLPALKPWERRLLYVGLPAAVLLFLGGGAFGWYVVVPTTRAFFLRVAAGAGVQAFITPGAYIGFVMGICLPLGLAFQLPLLVGLLARIGLLSARKLSRVRKYAFLVILVLAAVLSPPDVISMALFLVPLYGLYELSIVLARAVAPDPGESEGCPESR